MIVAREHFVWRAGKYAIPLGERTLLMGIVNVTPDSFSGDGVLSRRRKERTPGLAHALGLVNEGADIIDIGGESSRPGAEAVGAEEEMSRVVPLVEALAGRVKVPLSVDTWKPAVAARALQAGASIVNLIRGTPASPALLKVVGRAGAGLVLMHMRGTPKTMQNPVHTRYRDVVREVAGELKKTLDKCPGYAIKKENIVVDPGICFAKTVEQNLVLLRRLGSLSSLGFPLLVGTSRKSFIGKILGVAVTERLTATAASAALAAACGAHVVRVHDVKAVKQAVLMADAVCRA